jgi:hypothetical protein
MSTYHIPTRVLCVAVSVIHNRPSVREDTGEFPIREGVSAVLHHGGAVEDALYFIWENTKTQKHTHININTQTKYT